MREEAHKSLLLIMKTIGSRFTDEMQIHIPGARTKVSEDGCLTDSKIEQAIIQVIKAFITMMKKHETIKI